MAGTEEPTQKKSRRTRTIELDLSLFPDWVGTADDNTLLEVFALGVKVRDSIAIKITENPEYITNILGEKLLPVYAKVDTVSQEFKSVQNKVTRSLTTMESGVSALQNTVVNNITEVARKVQPLDSLNSKIDSKIAEVLKPIERCEEKLNNLVTRYERPAVKGALGEQEVLTTLKASFPRYTISHIGGQGHTTDITIKPPNTGHQYLVEVKDHQKGIAFKAIEKFKKDVRDNKDYKVGILFSLRSGIDVLASHGRFTIQFQDQQYYIYVPNALNERDDLIVWIVMLADQLAVLDRGLTDPQTGKLNELLTEFQEKMKLSKSCETNLAALERSVNELKKNMVPLLDVIKSATRKLNSALNK